MKRLTSLLNRHSSGYGGNAPPDSPEANASKGVKLFCEAGSAANSDSQGEEVLHLPVIVEAAESAPLAAAAAATQIRKYLSRENYGRPHVQYNAIMLISILSNNPGPTFTRNLDQKFVATTRDLLRQSRDPSVQQLLRETLQQLNDEKAYDTNLSPLLAMWNKERTAPQSHFSNPPPASAAAAAAGGRGLPPPLAAGQETYFARPHRNRSLPPAPELAARIEEARTTAKLLMQLVQSSTSAELESNPLVKEFAERCQSAQRSVQGYINSDDPAPDADTLQTLIETNEQLSLAGSRHQRAMLQARRELAANTPPPVAPSVVSADTTSPPASNGTTAYPQYNTQNYYNNSFSNDNVNTNSHTSTYPTQSGPNSSLAAPSSASELPSRNPVSAPVRAAENPFSDDHAAAPTNWQQQPQQQLQQEQQSYSPESRPYSLVSPIDGGGTVPSGGVTYRY